MGFWFIVHCKRVGIMEYNVFLLFCGAAQWKLHLLNTMLKVIYTKISVAR